MTEITYKPGTFARFFKAVKGRLVSRYGTARYAADSFRNARVFGGSRKPLTQPEILKSGLSPLSARPCNPVELNTEIVTAITKEEARKFWREYDRHVHDGDLEEVDEAAYVAFLKEDAKRAKEAVAKAKKLAEEREAAAKRDAELAEQQKAAGAAKTSGADKPPKKTKPKGKRAASGPEGDTDGPEGSG